ncbi:MAG: Hpt domain-containing protein [Sandaracinaceae bacterium]
MIEQLHEMLAFAGPEAIRDIFQLYLADVPRRIDALQDALAHADAEGLRRAAHGLRGSSVSIGANKLAELCGALEEGTVEPKRQVAAILAESAWVVELVNAEIARLENATPMASTG